MREEHALLAPGRFAAAPHSERPPRTLHVGGVERSLLGRIGLDLLEAVRVVGVPDDRRLRSLGRLAVSSEGPEGDSHPEATCERTRCCNRSPPGLSRLDRLWQGRRVARGGAEPGDVAVTRPPLELLQVVVREEQDAELAVRREAGVADDPCDVRGVLDRDLRLPPVPRDREPRYPEDERGTRRRVGLLPVEACRLGRGLDRRRRGDGL